MTGSAAPRGAAAARCRALRGRVVRELHLPHLDADALAIEVADRAGKPHDDGRARLTDHPLAADLELEPALGLDQVLGHARRQSGDAGGVELAREVREVDAVRCRHDGLEERRSRGARRLRRGEHGRRLPRERIQQQPDRIAAEADVGVEEHDQIGVRARPERVPRDRLPCPCGREHDDRVGWDGRRRLVRRVEVDRRDRPVRGVRRRVQIVARGTGVGSRPVQADERRDGDARGGESCPCGVERAARWAASAHTDRERDDRAHVETRPAGSHAGSFDAPTHARTTAPRGAPSRVGERRRAALSANSGGGDAVDARRPGHAVHRAELSLHRGVARGRLVAHVSTVTGARAERGSCAASRARDGRGPGPRR